MFKRIVDIYFGTKCFLPSSTRALQAASHCSENKKEDLSMIVESNVKPIVVKTMLVACVVVFFCACLLAAPMPPTSPRFLPGAPRPAATYPTEPQNVQATGGNMQIVLTWQMPASNGGSAITGYNIYRGTSSGGEIFYTNPGNVTTYTDGSLTNGQTYYYVLAAINGVGQGDPAIEVYATPAIALISSDQAGDEWPMFHGALNHTGTVTTPSPVNGTEPIWNYTTGDYVASSPAVAGGYVYVGSNDNKIYCLNATTGAKIWSYTTGDYVFSSPAIAEGRVYVGSYDNNVYCLNATSGTKIWNYTTGYRVESSPAVAGGRVYVGSTDDKIYCLNATTGVSIWNYTTGYWVESSPAIAEGRVYVGSGDNKIYCLNATTGVSIWNYTMNDEFSCPAVAGGCVYVGSNDGKIYCLNATTGVSIWN